MFLARARLLKRIDVERVRQAIAAAEHQTSVRVRVSLAPFFWGDVRRVAERAFTRLGRHGVLILVVPSRRQFVVLRRRRCPPDGHHRIADELLHRAAVQGDQPSACVEVARQELPHLLGVSRFGKAREADEVGEEDGDEAALSGGGLVDLAGRVATGDGRGAEWRAAFAAEALVGLVRRPTCLAGGAERAPALGAELPAFAIRSTAAWADRHLGSEPTAGLRSVQQCADAGRELCG